MLSAALLFGCGGNSQRKSYDTVGESGLTTRTENLQANLFTYQDKGVMIGQVCGTVTAVGEKGDSVQGDIYKMVDDKPACIGFELRGVESGETANIRSVAFSDIRKSVLAHFKKQGLVALSWAMPDYGNDENKLAGYTDRVASFVSSLQDDYGIKVPVALVLCPLGQGEWYDRLSAEDYKDMYKRAVELLRGDTLTNAIFAYSNGAGPTSVEEFMLRCPDDCVDVVQLDFTSDKPMVDYGSSLMQKASSLSQYCNEHMKAFGVCGGVKGLNGDEEGFLSKAILPVLQSVRMSYFMFGPNFGDPDEHNYFLPFAGHDGVNDFANIYNDKHTVFLRGLNGLLVDHSSQRN